VYLPSVQGADVGFVSSGFEPCEDDNIFQVRYGAPINAEKNMTNGQLLVEPC
jgi:hypothetical protein